MTQQEIQDIIYPRRVPAGERDPTWAEHRASLAERQRRTEARAREARENIAAMMSGTQALYHVDNRRTVPAQGPGANERQTRRTRAQERHAARLLASAALPITHRAAAEHIRARIASRSQREVNASRRERLDATKAVRTKVERGRAVAR